MENIFMKSHIVYGLYLIIWIIIPNIIQTILAPIAYPIIRHLLKNDYKGLRNIAVKFSWMDKLVNVSGNENALQLIATAWVFIWKYFITSSNFEELCEKVAKEL